jgi:hypothetical protein
MWGQSWQRVETGTIGEAPAGTRAMAVPLHDKRISPLPCRATGAVRLFSGRLSPQEFSTPPPVRASVHRSRRGRRLAQSHQERPRDTFFEHPHVRGCGLPLARQLS